MYLKNDRIVVRFKNLTFRSYKVTGKNEFILDPTAITGWTDGTAVRRDTTPRATSSGDFPEPAKMSARVISLSGTAVAENRAKLQEMRDSFMGSLGSGDYTVISVETSVGTRYSTVGLEGTPMWVQQLDNVASWKIDLYAPDPYIYGQTTTIPVGADITTGGLSYVLSYPLNYNSSGQNTTDYISQKGNVDSWPVFRVTGDYYSGFSITDNFGSVVTFTGVVTMQAPVYIDMGRGTATQSGVDKTSLVTRRDWFSLPVGGAIKPQFNPIQNGSGWCDIIYRDTWI